MIFFLFYFNLFFIYVNSKNSITFLLCESGRYFYSISILKIQNIIMLQLFMQLRSMEVAPIYIILVSYL